ncbi:hypothetical protein NPIL_409701 [Nephila pilipes]|uniref:Uncharacterized protein n=1 Tax=Nephila pilipes TaxID=299642 RepID=A0A8X6TNK1_NEPPI|nr:hypothetical protein NPIL_409701 [Nephila pilipes]
MLKPIVTLRFRAFISFPACRSSRDELFGPVLVVIVITELNIGCVNSERIEARAMFGATNMPNLHNDIAAESRVIVLQRQSVSWRWMTLEQTNRMKESTRPTLGVGAGVAPEFERLHPP